MTTRTLPKPTASRTPRKTDGTGRPARRPVRYVVLSGLVVLALLVLAPFLLVAINAVKTPSEYASGGPLSLPGGLHLSSLIDFWNRSDFGLMLINSFLISLGAAVIGVVLSTLNAYAIGIGRMRGRNAFLIFFLIANVLPQEELVYPLYYAAKSLNLYDSRTALIIIFGVIHSAFGAYLLSSVYGEFPRELLDAASVDGAGRLRTLWHVVIPISRSTLTVLFTFFFIWTWNEFFFPLIFLVSNNKQTVPVALGLLQGQNMMDVTTTSSSALLGILPAVLFFQRTMSRGITSGALK
ncbi:carbohydrate ABC transporter permease [Catenulispora yoronensis]|uniref:Carbohydrate ABC transporter permease n=1 Tax=Catenulispora yoronensis TaxID=450799 RepID=A0ABN2TIT2_9ACTN